MSSKKSLREKLFGKSEKAHKVDVYAVPSTYQFDSKSGRARPTPKPVKHRDDKFINRSGLVKKRKRKFF